MSSEPQPVEYKAHCPSCDRMTLDKYPGGIEECECGYEDGRPLPEALAPTHAPLEGPSHLLTLADVRDQIIPPPEEGFQVESMADVKAKPISWLWKGRIPRSMLTLLVGDGGLGKSQVSLDLAARITSGVAWPDGTPGDEPRNVLILSAEDVADMVLKPRLTAVGADSARVFRIKSVLTKERIDRHVSLETDVKYLDLACKKYNPSLIIIDPMNAYMGKAETFKDNHVRAILAPVVAVAEKYGVAILAIMHLNKDSAKKALYRTMGSVAFPAAARSSLLVSEDPENHRILVTHAKANLSKKAKAMAYVVEDVDLGGGIETSRVVWQADEIEITADEAMELTSPQRKVSKIDAAVSWLEKTLAAGPVPSKELEARAAGAGIKGGTLLNARSILGVEAVKTSAGGPWLAALPAHSF